MEVQSRSSALRIGRMAKSACQRRRSRRIRCQTSSESNDVCHECSLAQVQCVPSTPRKSSSISASESPPSFGSPVARASNVVYSFQLRLRFLNDCLEHAMTTPGRSFSYFGGLSAAHMLSQAGGDLGALPADVQGIAKMLVVIGAHLSLRDAPEEHLEDQMLSICGTTRNELALYWRQHSLATRGSFASAATNMLVVQWMIWEKTEDWCIGEALRRLCHAMVDHAQSVGPLLRSDSPAFFASQVGVLFDAYSVYRLDCDLAMTTAMLEDVMGPDLARTIDSEPNLRVYRAFLQAELNPDVVCDLEAKLFMWLRLARHAAARVYGRRARRRRFDARTWDLATELALFLDEYEASHGPEVTSSTPDLGFETAAAIHEAGYINRRYSNLMVLVLLGSVINDRLRTSTDAEEIIELLERLPQATRMINHGCRTILNEIANDKQIACSHSVIFLWMIEAQLIDHLTTAPSNAEFTERDRLRALQQLRKVAADQTRSFRAHAPSVTRLDGEIDRLMNDFALTTL